MIAKVYAFLLCCFAATSNINTIVSAGDSQIFPLRSFFQISNEYYVRAVNNLRTFNKCPIKIEQADVLRLTTTACGSSKKYQSKLNSRVKLEKKAKDLKCSFCVVAKSNILYLQNLIEKLNSGEPFVENDREQVKRLEEEAKVMLQILYAENLETGKWLWMYFLKILAVGQYDDNATLLREKPMEVEQLQNRVSDFIGNCVVKNYLPPTAIGSDLVMTNPTVYREMLCGLRSSRWVLDGGDFVTVEFLYLKPFWDAGQQILFGQITEANVDWTVAKRRLEDQVAVTREFVRDRLWIYKPYDRLDHQTLLIEIIDARIYCYLSVVLFIYQSQLTVLDGRALRNIKYLIEAAIQDALTATAFKDDHLVAVLSELEFARTDNVDEIKDISEKVRAKAEEILIRLNGALANNAIDFLSFNVDLEQLSTDNLIKRAINNLKYYLTELKHFLPFDYRLLLHFTDVA